MMMYYLAPFAHHDIVSITTNNANFEWYPEKNFTHYQDNQKQHLTFHNVMALNAPSDSPYQLFRVSFVGDQ